MTLNFVTACYTLTLQKVDVKRGNFIFMQLSKNGTIRCFWYVTLSNNVTMFTDLYNEFIMHQVIISNENVFQHY